MPRIPRFYCRSLPAPGDTASLEADQAHHLARVLRLGPGAAVELVDGEGGWASAEVVAARKAAATVLIHERRQEAAPVVAVEVACPLPKGPRADAMVEALTQIGVSRLTLLRTARSVVDPRDTKVDRLRKICESAMLQCGRLHAITVAEPVGLDDFLDACGTGRRLCYGDPAGGRDIEPASDGSPGTLVSLIVGPEGGLTDAEQGRLRAAGAQPLWLGPHVLRLETAAVVGGARLVASVHGGSALA